MILMRAFVWIISATMTVAATAGVAGTAAPTPQARLACYASSLDSEAGFHDEALSRFQEDLARFGESHLEIVSVRESADVRVQLLGKGTLRMEIPGESIEPPLVVFEPNPDGDLVWAVVRLGQFAKPFSARGSRNRSLSRLASNIAEWMEENQAELLKRK